MSLLLFQSCCLPRFFKSLFTAVCTSCHAAFGSAFITFPWVCAAKKQCQAVPKGTALFIAQTDSLILPQQFCGKHWTKGWPCEKKKKPFTSTGKVAASISKLIFLPCGCFVVQETVNEGLQVFNTEVTLKTILTVIPLNSFDLLLWASLHFA